MSRIYKRNELIMKSMASKDESITENPMRKSFFDFMSQRHSFDFNKVGCKSVAYDQLQLKKIRAIYGCRGSLRLEAPCGDTTASSKHEGKDNKKKLNSRNEGQITSNKSRSIQMSESEGSSFLDKFTIHPDSKWKSFFDVCILVLVGYSCITNLYITAFSVEMSYVDVILFWIVEVFFYFDFSLSWFMGYRDPETMELVQSFESIAKNYIKGWFIIDFISIFPFQILVSAENGSATKLMRMPRMLRLGKLLDIKNVKRIMKTFSSETNTADDIVKLFYRLFLYKLCRLLIVLIILTYFQGCLWFLMSKLHEPSVEGQTTWYKEFGLADYEYKTD